MSSAISELWEGIIEPKRPAQIKDTKLKHTLYLTEKESEAQKEAFERYCDYKEDYSLLLCEQAFCDGFSLGMRLAAEAFGGGGQF